MLEDNDDEDEDENCYWRDEMLRLLRTLTPELLALCHLGIAQAAQAAPPGAGAKQTNKAAHFSEEEGAAKTARSRFTVWPSSERYYLRYGVPLLLPLWIFFAIGFVSASEHTKLKEITPETYGRWNRIKGAISSDDGKWVAYTLETAQGAGELIVRSTEGDREFRVPQGVISQAALSHGDRARLNGLGVSTHITTDSRFVLFIFSDDGKDTKYTDDLSHSSGLSLGIMTLPDGRVTKVSGVSAFIVPSSEARYVAYRPQVRSTHHTDEGRAEATIDDKLVLRELTSGAQVSIPSVREFRFDSKGRYLAYSVDAQDSQRNGVYVRRLSDGREVALLAGPGDYQGLQFDQAGQRLAFLSTRDSTLNMQGQYTIYYASSLMDAAVSVVSAETLRRRDLRIDAKSGVKFTRMGNALIFGVAATEKASTTTKKLAQNASFDLWHWKGQQPWVQGMVGPGPKLAPGEQEDCYLAVYHIKERRWIQLGNASHPKILVTDDARYAVGIREDTRLQWNIANAPYRADVWLVDGHSSRGSLFRRGMEPSNLGSYAYRHSRYKWGVPRIDASYYMTLSPGGRYLLYFEDHRWWSVDLATGIVRDLTGGLLPLIRFDRQAARNPASRSFLHSPAGIAGWTEQDRRVLVYSQHDLWEIDPAGVTSPRNLTSAIASGENVIFRLWEDFDLALHYPLGTGDFLPYSGPFIDTTRPLLAFGVDQDTMASGIWRIHPSANTSPKRLLELQKRIKPVGRARRDSPQYVVTVETFSEYPDLWTGSRFDRLRRISDANPQQREYRGGVGELIAFTSDFGVPLKGRLYTPVDFDPSKRYPMVVAVYQEMSPRLHAYAYPEPLSAAPDGGMNWARGVAKGYLYFVPDVMPAPLHPGPSAVAAVVPAVQSIVQRGIVDAERIALSGHSFGGYETNYLITQTSLFRCAISSAGAANLISLHGTDGAGPGFLERGQMIAGSLWDHPLVYMTNSAVLYANQVRTPLLIMHNEVDDHPPMSQSREMFIALHRNDKEVYWFNYHTEGHTLSSYRNQLDWDSRVNEFLDHCLQDAPRPTWMKSN